MLTADKKSWSFVSAVSEHVHVPYRQKWFYLSQFKTSGEIRLVDIRKFCGDIGFAQIMAWMNNLRKKLNK